MPNKLKSKKQLSDFYAVQLASFMGLAEQAKNVRKEVIEVYNRHFEDRDFKVKKTSRSTMVAGEMVRCHKAVNAFTDLEVEVLVSPYCKDGETISGRIVKISVNDLLEVK